MNHKFKFLYQRLQPLLDRPMLMSSLVVALSLLWLILSQGLPKEESSKPTDSLDTFIPAGQVLVPISIQNFESVDSIFGHHGVVDLYAISPTGSATTAPVAQGVKMIRAPKNPSQFGVLLPSQNAPQLVRRGGPFYVVIHNKGEFRRSGIVFEAKPKIAGPRVIYESEDEK